MYRLLGGLIFGLTIAFTAMLGLAVLVGQTLADNQQVVYLETRADGWTAVKLLTLDRQLSANRYLPMQALAPRWSPDGKRLIVQGITDQALWWYVLDYDPLRPARRWLSPTLYDLPAFFPFSPDLRWVVQIEAAADGEAVNIYSVDDPPQSNQIETEITTINDIRWSPDSRYLIYSQSGRYAVVDVSTQQRRQISEETLYDLQFAPNSQFVSFGLPTKPLLPSPDVTDYSFKLAYYAMNLATGETHLITDTGINEVYWSPDSLKLAYVEQSSPQAQPSLIDQLLVNPVPWYKLFPHLVFIEEVRMDNLYLQFGNGTTQGMYMTSGLSLHVESLPEHQQTYIVDTATWTTQALNLTPITDPYEIMWLSNSEGFLVGAQHAVANRRASRESPYGQPMLNSYETVSYLAMLDGSPVRRIKEGNDELAVVMMFGDSNQILLAPQKEVYRQDSRKSLQTLYVMDVKADTITPLNLHDESFFFAIWSPDNQHIILVTQINKTPPFQPNPIIPGVTRGTPTPSPLPGLANQVSTIIYRTYLLRAGDPKPRLLLDSPQPGNVTWSLDSQSLFYAGNVYTGNIMIIEDIYAAEWQPYAVNSYWWVRGSASTWRPR